MDKQLLKAYIRTIVEEEVKRVLPELLGEAVREIKTLSENTRTAPAARTTTKPSIDRGRLAELMGITREDDTLIATSEGVGPGRTAQLPVENLTDGQKEVVDAMNRDYSHLMKAMKLS